MVGRQDCGLWEAFPECRAPVTFAFAIANRQATLAKTMTLQAESKAENFSTSSTCSPT